ncbi:hypothetical protein CY35_08G100300 [Sphagnum magellanicum]|nr:hypothetical protein CY35_08G100300 [Sphagnum magellanicum]
MAAGNAGMLQAQQLQEKRNAAHHHHHHHHLSSYFMDRPAAAVECQSKDIRFWTSLREFLLHVLFRCYGKAAPGGQSVRNATAMSKTRNYKVEKERVAESMLGSAVTGTLYGQRKGRVTFCVQEDSRSAPLLLLEFAMPTQSLVREMSTGLLRIALECEKSNKNACKELKAGGLFAEPVWTMFCNGRKVGFAIKRQLVDADRDVLGVMQSVTMGAGVIPAAVAQEAACKQAAVLKRDSDDDQAIMYMRARYERVAGSPDNLSFHMINPNGSPGQELSIFFIRV